MGTRATVKFFDNEKLVLALYEQYDGYEEGVGRKISHLITDYELVNGIPVDSEDKIANGIGDLALMYALQEKEGAGGIYATTKDDSQAFNYEVYAKYNEDLGRDEIYKIVIISSAKGYTFEGSAEEFNEYIMDEQYPGW